MATLQVQSNGNAPSNAKVGDHIITAGGTYEVMDGSKYQGLSEDQRATQLAADGIGYNPSSGLYSKKISDVSTNAGTTAATTPRLSLQTFDTAEKWRNQQNQKVSADLDSAYYQNRQDAYNSYMDAITRQNQQANDVNASYLDNISKLYDNTYQNNNAVLERMASRGLTSSGLGNAMQVAALADASKKNADLRFQRNRDLNNIETEMNNLTNQYNVNLDTLAKKLRSDKISALSNNEIAFLEAVMSKEEWNANAENSALMTQYQLANENEQAMLQREFTASESALDRALQRELQAASLGGSGGSYGGGGGYRRGGYSRRGYSYGRGSGSSGGGGTALQRLAGNFVANNRVDDDRALAIAKAANSGNTVKTLDLMSGGALSKIVKKGGNTALKMTTGKTTKNQGRIYSHGSASGKF